MREKKVKQPKNGLKIDKNLRVVKTAGFRAEKRRDKSVNRRAGLHDKTKNLKGERRIYKRKPLGLVRVRRIKQVVATMSAAGVAVVAYFSMGFLFKPDFVYVEELGNSTVCAVKSGAETNGMQSAAGNIYYMPEDGSLPTEHTLIENIAYMNYVLQNQSSWSSYMESSVKTVMEQKVYTHKKYYDGKLISADMPQGASNIARQFCVTDTDVSWREKSKNYIYDNMDNIAWPTDAPVGLTIAEFRIYRGLPANEFSVYILNELTVKNFNETTVEEKGVDENGKRLYTMTLDLRVHQSGLDSAVHYYKQQMYVTGGLYAWPTFDYTYVEYTFTEDWVIKEFTINDGYSAKMGTVSAPCTSSSTTVFDYAEENAVNTYYPDYFYQPYSKWDPTSSANEPTAASCLASAFGDVLTQGATLKLELTVDNRPVNGAVYLGMADGSFSDLRVALEGAAVGGIKLYMVDENGKKTLYVAIGANKYKICLDDFISSDGASAEAVALEENGEEVESGGIAFDANALLEQLFDGKFTLSDKGSKATLESEIEIFGLKIPLKFSFNIKKNIASLNEVTASFKLGKNNVAARLTFGTEEDIPAQLTAAEKSAYTDVKDGITLGVGLGYGDIQINGNVFLGFADGGLGEVRAKFGELSVYYAPAENVLYFAHGQNVKYKLNLADIFSDGSFDLNGIVGGLDINSIITDIISNFYMGGGTVSTGFNIDLQKQLQQILNLAVSVDLNNGIAVDINSEIFGKPLKLNVKLASEKVPEIGDKSEYVDILNGGISADVSLTIDGLKLDGVLYLGLENGEISFVRVALNNEAVKIFYERELNGAVKEDVIYIDIGSSKIKLPLSALTSGAEGGLDLTALLKDVNIKDILAQAVNNLGGGEFKVSSSLSLEIGGETVPLNVNLGFGNQIAVNVETSLFGKNIAANVALGNGKAPVLTDKEKYVDIINGGFALSGDILLNVNGKTVILKVNSLALKLNGGFEFEIDARIIAWDRYFDLYVSYLNGTVTLVYGSDEGTESDKGNYVGVRVNTADDLELLKAALTDAYDRLCAVLGEIAPSYSDALSKENLENLVGGLGAGSASADILSEIFKILGIEVKEGETVDTAFVFEKLGIPADENGKIDIKGLLKAIEIKPYGNGFALNLGENISVNFGITAGAVDGGASLQIGNASASIELTGFKLGKFAPECPISANELLTAQDLADALDYIVAAFELVTEKEFTADASAVITENGEAVMEVGVLVEYSQGENGFPVHFDAGTLNNETGLRENVNFWVDSTAYLHLGVSVTDKKANGNNLFVDVYVLDATPVTSGFKTSGGYTADGMLDVYVSISNGGGNPMAVYLPMKDILTIAAMGGAMLNIAEIKLENDKLADINTAIQQVANVIDQLLIQNYLGELSSQFHSIGDSIVEQILRGQKIEASNLSELIDLLLKSVFGTQNGEDQNGDGNGENGAVTVARAGAPLVSCGNYVKRVNLDRTDTERTLTVVLNSSAIYGSGYSDIEFSVSKNFYSYGIMPIETEDGETVTQTVNKSYITGLALKNIYYGENNTKKLDLAVNIGYETVIPASFENYHNFTDISKLIGAFVNSATHEEADETDEEETETVTATDIAKKYALNSNYYIDGKVELGLVVFGNNIGATININNFYVTINEDNTVEFNVTISYSKVSVIVFTMIENSATVDLTIKDDMIFMRKTTDDGKSYVTRAMTLDDFSKDLMYQLKFILSLSDKMMDMMNGGSGGGGLKFNDYGDYLDAYLANYGFTDGGSAVNWNVTVNKQAINSLAGMDVFSENISVDFNASRNANDTFSLRTLSVNSKMFNMLTLKASLNYRNPQNIWEDGNDLSGNAVKLDCKAQYGVDGRSWAHILGGTKFEDISATVNWSKLCRDTSGRSYVEYDGSNLRFGTLKFMYATDVSNEEFAEFGERQKVLYGKNVYTVLEMPDVNEVMPAVPNGNDRLVGAWEYSYVSTEETDENGAVIAMYAKYGAVTVSIISTQYVDGGINGFTDYIESEDLGYVYYKTFKYDDTEEIALFKQANLNTYLFKGYFDYYTGEAVESFVADRAVTLYANWVGKTINITYASDVAFSGGEADEDGIYTIGGSVQYGVSDSLRNPVTELENVAFLGWFMEYGESYVYVANANALKEYCANIEISGDSLSVKLWAVWYNDTLNGEITSATHSGSVLHNWYVSGRINSPFSGKSADIAAASGELNVSMTMVYYVSKDGVELTKDINWKSAESVNADGSFEKTVKNSTVGTGTGKYFGGEATVTISLNGASDINITGNLFKQV